jgi:hypothetical protein
LTFSTPAICCKKAPFLKISGISIMADSYPRTLPRTLAGKVLPALAVAFFTLIAGAENVVTLYPTDDLWVEKEGPDVGRGTELKIDPFENYWTYLKFSLADLPDSIVDARLELYYSLGSVVPVVQGIECRLTTDGWNEATLMGYGAPEPLLNRLATGALGTNQRIAYWDSEEFPLKIRQEYIKDRTVSFILKDSGDYAGARREFFSSEYSEVAKRPRLVLTLADQSFTPTPSATATRTPSRTPTPTPSETPTVTETGTPTPTETATPSATGTPSPTPSPSPTATPTATGTGTITATPTVTPTPTWDVYDLSGDGRVEMEDLYFLAADGIYQASGRDEVFLLTILEKIEFNRR